MVEIMSDEVSPQKHSLNICLKLVAGLEGALESCISLVSMPCIQNLVVGINSSLYFVLSDQCSQLFLQQGHRGLESISHCVKINRYKWKRVLYDSFVANILVQSLQMFMQMNIQKEIWL